MDKDNFKEYESCRYNLPVDVTFYLKSQFLKKDLTKLIYLCTNIYILVNLVKIHSY